MKIAITGGAGFLARRLAGVLLTDPKVERVVLADVVPVEPFSRDSRLDLRVLDLTDPKAAAAAAEGADVIYHLAAVVSGQAEVDFDKGMRVNLDATRGLLEAARAGGGRPKFIFTSSLAVFGPPFPVAISEWTAARPQSSYGSAKAMGELLVAEYSRRGFIDGRVLRLPTICVRPGEPNAAASSFVSGIIREPLHGEEAVCPVGRDLELWLSSPRTAVANLVHGALLGTEALGPHPVLNLPGITVTVAEMIAALERVAGAAATARIVFEEVPVVKRIVSSWPARFDVSRAVALGFGRDPDFESLIRGFLADEGSGRTVTPF